MFMMRSEGARAEAGRLLRGGLCGAGAVADAHLRLALGRAPLPCRACWLFCSAKGSALQQANSTGREAAWWRGSSGPERGS